MSTTATKVNFALNSVVITGLMVCVVIGGVLMEEAREAALLLANTKELAQELRQSSDDLTRFIRTYTVTGNASYWGYFQEVIKIRNGEAPLPKQPWRNHWDLYISDGQAPREYLPPASLLDRMRAAKFSDAEMELLEEAKRQSDALIDLEDVAAHAMQGLFRPNDTAGLTEAEARAFSVEAPANQTLAMQLVHSIPYHVWKGRIMRPLDDFAAVSNQRVLDAVDANYRLNLILVVVLGCMLASLIGLLLFYFVKVRNDAQVTGLLTTMLPLRVVESVSVRDFGELRALASDHARKLRKSRGVVTHVEFPVLYSEFLPMAWVAFTDVVGFTSMCRGTPAKVVISILNELFSILDVEAMSYGIEKIKTIGDAFMCARLTTSELQAEEGNIAKDGALMVKYLLRAMHLARCVRNPVPDADNKFLSLRAGLHVGPVASGIVGFERPLYDLFGDTVNTAARLEASGRSDRVHVMATTMTHFGETVKDIAVENVTTQVELKGIGEVSTQLITAYRGDGSSTGAPADATYFTESYELRPEYSPAAHRRSEVHPLPPVPPGMTESAGAVYEVDPAQP